MGSEIVPETACLQVVGAPSGVTAYFLHNGPASYSYAARLSDERSRSESEGKTSWRAEPTYVEKWADDLWIGVKG
jgi:hypothetical protein